MQKVFTSFKTHNFKKNMNEIRMVVNIYLYKQKLTFVCFLIFFHFSGFNKMFDPTNDVESNSKGMGFFCFYLQLLDNCSSKMSKSKNIKRNCEKNKNFRV